MTGDDKKISGEEKTLAQGSEELAHTLPVEAGGASLGTDATLAVVGEVTGESSGEAPGEAPRVTPEAPGRYVFPARGEDLELGRGGIGRVLIALDSHLGREIAIKELLPETRGESGSGTGGGSGSDGKGSARVTSPAVARFFREARVTGQLEHPNIVPVYELGRRDDGTLYYAMKLVRGRTLAQALREADGLLGRLKLLSHYVDLCQAIAYAHSRGVIHRDIKPDNVMLGEFGETVVLDWGLAKTRDQEDLRAGEMRREIKLLKEDTDATMAGATLGTPAYMSPEQAEGDLDRVDEQSDVWSLGAVLYELLTGRPPHTGPTVHAVLCRVVTEEVVSVRERDSAIPPDLAAITDKALCRDRQGRYETARELVEEVEAFQSGARVSSYQYSSWELLKRFVQRNRALSGAAVALVVLLVVGSLMVYQAYRRAEVALAGEAQARERAEVARRAEHREHLHALERERLSHLNLATAYEEKAQRLVEDHEFSAARIFSAAALLHNPRNPLGPHYGPLGSKEAKERAAAGLVAAQSTLFSAYMHQAIHFKKGIHAHKNEIWSVAFFPGGQRVASGSRDHTVKIFSAGRGKELKELKVLRGSPGPLFEVAVSPDGKTVAGACGDGAVRLWDSDSGEIKKTLKAHKGPAVAADFSSDGGRLVTSGMDHEAHLWDLKTGKKLVTFRHKNKHVWAAALSPDDTLLATASWQGDTPRASLWRVADGELQANLEGHLGPVWTVAWSPDGKELATGGVDKTIRLWSVKDGRQRSRLLHHRADVTQVRYSGDGHHLVSVGVDRQLVLWRRATETVLASHRGHRHHVWSCALSRGARQVVTGGWDGRLRIYDVRPDGRAPAHYIKKGRVAMNIAFTPSGKELLFTVGPEVRVLQTPDIPRPGGAAKRRRGAPFKSSGGARPKLLGALSGHEKEVDAVAVSHDGRWVATGARDGTARLWDLKARRQVAVLKDHQSRVFALAFSPKGDLLATGGRDKMVRLWRVPSGKPAGVLSGHAAPVVGVAISRDGSRLASTSGNRRIRIWTLPGGKPEPSIEGVPRDIARLAFIKGGRWILAAAASDLILIDTKSRKEIRRLKGHTSEIFRLEVTADERYAVTSGRDDRVILWDLKTLRSVQSLQFDTLPLGISIRDDQQGFAVCTGVPIQFFPLSLDLWRQDPKALLERAQKRAGLKLQRFRLVTPP